MSSSKPFRPSSRGSAEAATSSTSVSTAVPPAFQASPFADTCEPNSFSEVSVRSECDQVNFQNSSLASVDTSKNNTTYRIPPELEKKRIEGPLFDSNQPDFINFHEESIPFFPNLPGSSLLWLPTSDICEVMIHGRQPSFEKHSDRVVPNPWRRYGTLTKLMSVGGWSNKRKKSICFQVKPGTPPPHAPNAPQMMLHRDPRRPIQFTYPPKNFSSEICAKNFAIQIALRVENSWMPKVWCNQKRLHFMDTSSYHQHPQRHANTSTSKYQVSTMPTHSRSSSSASGSIDENDCSTALTGQFSNVSVSSTSTATPNIRKPKQRNGGK